MMSMMKKLTMSLLLTTHLTCGNIKEIDRISFPYFTTFPNSGELEVQFVSEKGSTGFEVEGDEPFIDLKGKI